MWRVLGGRKSTSEAIEQIVYLALGGAGVIALEDAVGKLRGGGKAKPSGKK